MAEFNRLYEKAFYYDIVFDRDVTQEADFISAAYQYHTGKAVSSVLDICCGPGYHARTFARRGIRTVGLDLRPEMLTFAEKNLASEDLPVCWVQSDMRDFSLSRPVDAAFCLFYGIDALLTHDDLVKHLQSVARNLTPGGIYVLHYLHPRDCSYAKYPGETYQGERDGVGVRIDWGTNHPLFDPVTNVADVEITLTIDDRGNRTVRKDSARERMILPVELSLLARLSGVFCVAGFYGDYRIDQPLDDSPNATKMVVVLQRGD